MRRTVYLFAIILLIFAGASCSDDFLDRNDADWYYLSDTLFLSNYDHSVAVSFELPERIKSDFTVFMHPRWLAFPSPHGQIDDGTVPLAFYIEDVNVPSGYNSHIGTVVLDIVDYGFVSLTVIFTNFGAPRISCTPEEIVFDRTYSHTLDIRTVTDGLLVWEIRDIPEWLNFSRTSGMLLPGQNEAINITLNPGMITPETDTDVNVTIASNSVTGDYLLRVRVTPETVLQSDDITINGIVTDAEFHHESGLLAICTKSPNSLLLYRTVSGESETIALDKTPGCISISEDGHRAVLGYTVTSVGYVDLDDGEVISEFSVDCIPFDIVLGESGWCYITPSTGQWEVLRNLNLNTGELISNKTNTTLYERTVIKKIKGKPFMAGSRQALSPSGLLLFSLTGEGPANDTITKFHEEINTPWVSTDGSRLYAATGKVYDMPQYTTDPYTPDLLLFGELEKELTWISAFDECQATGTVFVNTSYYYFMKGFSSRIDMFTTSNLTKTGSVSVTPVLLTENDVWLSYETSPHFLFVNKEGSVLFAVKTVMNGFSKDYWCIETINLN